MNEAQAAGAPARRPVFVGVAERFGFANPRRFASELMLITAVCLAAAAWGVFQFAQYDFVRLCKAFDFWFDSDPARTISNITSRWGPFHERSNLHPLYSPIIAAPFTVLAAVGLKTSTVTALYIGLQSAMLAGVSFVTLRAFGLMRFDAFLGVLLLYATAAGVYWIGFPEWFAFGSVSIIVCVAWVAGPASMRTPATGVAQNLASASMVVTSWAVGALASLVSDWPKLRWRQAFVHTRDALVIVACLTVVHYMIFPETGRFLDVWTEISRNVSTESDKSFLNYLAEFFGQTLVAPNPSVLEGPRNIPGWGTLIMSSQSQGVPVTPLTLLVFALWAALVTLGVFAVIRGQIKPATVAIVVGAFAFLFVLHMVFGGEVFLFSLQFAPFMMFIALWSTRSKFKLVARGLCVALIAASMAHNYPAFTSAITTHNAIDASWFDRDHDASRTVVLMDCR